MLKKIKQLFEEKTGSNWLKSFHLNKFDNRIFFSRTEAVNCNFYLPVGVVQEFLKLIIILGVSKHFVMIQYIVNNKWSTVICELLSNN